MCGIAGFCNLSNGWHENIERMNRRMMSRGPDDGGVWHSDDWRVVLGHRRLSILDLSESGKQPMHSHSGRHVIVYNGEIYNSDKLREKLIQDGFAASFKGHSDTEILLECIEAYGFEPALHLAKGMFAAAVYDRYTGKLSLARDRIGEKPLYYGFVSGGFIFASDIAAIAEHSCFDNRLNKEALSLYFQWGYIPAPYTIYHNIYKLEAGTIMELSPPYDKVKQYKYWDIMEIAKRGNENLFRGTFPEAVKELEVRLTDAVKSQMAADVPVGAFLSGGIDSSTVVALMQSLSASRVKTFSIGFAQKGYDEAVYAKETAGYLGVEHTELYVTEKEAAKVIPQISSVFGEPFADSSQIPTYLVSQLAREKVTVSLSGDGGDELFCGYGTYDHIDQIWRKIRYIPVPMRRASAGVLEHLSGGRYNKLHAAAHYIDSLTGEGLYARVGTVLPGTDKLVMGVDAPKNKNTAYPPGHLKGDLKNNLMLMDLQMYHPDDILVKVDRSAMAFSLETRVPMLDKDVVEFACALPLSYKMDGKITKRVLREVLYKFIPREKMDRPKKGFSMPVKEWCREGLLRNWTEDMLSESRLKREGILDVGIVTAIKKDFYERGVGDSMIWRLCMFEQWMEQ